ncbi:MAG: carbon storage regulator [Planctomycetaceae bacterium]|jgi:carbon storage regulator|nr:carbon storage regulator [Planctomycetaceae bacterium]
MLVLSRKEGERIRIGEDIFVTVVHAAKDKVHIGVDAPLETIILRDELRPKISVIDSEETTEKTNETIEENEINIALDNQPQDSKLAS